MPLSSKQKIAVYLLLNEMIVLVYRKILNVLLKSILHESYLYFLVIYLVIYEINKTALLKFNYNLPYFGSFAIFTGEPSIYDCKFSRVV